jgi:hypothetical protein
LKQYLDDCRWLVRELAKEPTELVMGKNPHYVGVKDASIHGVGGIILGDEKECHSWCSDWSDHRITRARF